MEFDNGLIAEVAAIAAEEAGRKTEIDAGLLAKAAACVVEVAGRKKKMDAGLLAEKRDGEMERKALYKPWCSLGRIKRYKLFGWYLF